MPMFTSFQAEDSMDAPGATDAYIWFLKHDKSTTYGVTGAHSAHMFEGGFMKHEGFSSLRARREHEGMTQRQLADASGVPFRTIQNWERFGIDMATVGKARRVAKALRCSVDDLL